MQLNIDIEKLYQKDYQFIDLAKPGNCSEAKVGASFNGSDLTNTYENDLTNMQRIISRTYENEQWYFVVFKPFDKAYERNPDWFKIKGLDFCRKMIKRPAAYILSRETEASKVHINMMICTSQNVLKKHDSCYCNKYKIHVQRLHDIIDRRNVLEYIMKESSDRPLTKYLDYISSR